MSIAVMTRVWAHSTHAGTELLLLLAIADYADDQGRAWPSVDTLARKARTTRRHVQRLLSRLEESGELRITRRSRSSTSPGISATHLYQVLVESEGRGDKMSPLRKGRRPGHGGGDLQVPRGATPRSPEPSLEPSVEPSISPLPPFDHRKSKRRPAEGPVAAEIRALAQGMAMP